MVRNLGEQPKRACIFYNPSQLTVSKVFVRSTKAACRSMLCSLLFCCICLSTKTMFVVPLLDPNLHWLSGMRGMVWSAWKLTASPTPPRSDGSTTNHVRRLSLEVYFNNTASRPTQCTDRHIYARTYVDTHAIRRNTPLLKREPDGAKNNNS